MVSQHEQLAGRQVPCLAAVVRHVGWLVLEDIWLRQLLPVHEDVAAVNVDRVAGKADDALDERRPGGVLDPTGRRVEYDDVAAVVVVEVGRDLVHEDELIGHQCVLHGSLLNPVRLSDEELDDQEDQQRDEECLEQLEEAAERSTVHKVASIGAVISSCPVDFPKRLGWLKSGRFLRLLSVVAALAVLAGLLYNAMMVDRIPPTYSITVSSPAGSGVAMTLTSIDVTFSEEVRHPTAEGAFSMTQVSGVAGAVAVAGTYHWQGQKLIFTPSAKLLLSTRFHVHMAPGVQDLAGNVQGGTADVDLTTVGAPQVTAMVPPAGSDSVAVDASIMITFDRFMDPQKVIAGLTLQPDITYQASWNGTVLTLDPTKSMEHGMTYTVRIADPAVDTDGTKLPPYVASFKTVDVGLRVASVTPAPNSAGVNIHSRIAVTYDSPIDPASIAGAIKLTPPVSGSIQTTTLPDDSKPTATPTPTPAATSAGSNVLVFTPDGPLAPHTTYTVSLSSTVKRTDGQASAGQTWTFITGEAPVNALNQVAFISNRSGVDNVRLMNFDGSNQREVTWELTPVNGYDISGDGTTIAYGTAGVVKKMFLSGDNLTTLTTGTNFEYAPTITPDGTGLIVGRRDGSGTDVGYWRYPLVSGADIHQVAPDGSPDLGSVAIAAGQRQAATGGLQPWAPRMAFTQDGTAMLLVRGADNVVELVDPSGATQPRSLALLGNSRPVWIQAEGAFYLTASADNGGTWACWRVTPAGVMTIVGPAAGEVAAAGSSLALIVRGGDGSNHLAFSTQADGSAKLLTDDPQFGEAGPSFSPDGKVIVFSRAGAQTPDVSAGIWTINTDGTGLTNLSTDGTSPRWVP